MSEILDALKKLDREKATRRNGTADIAVEILTPGLHRPGKKRFLYITVVSLTAIAAAVITYVVMVTFGVLPESPAPIRVNPPAPAQQAPPASIEPAVPSKAPPPAMTHRSVPVQNVAPAPREPDVPAESPSPVRASPPPPIQEAAPAPIEPAVPAKSMPPQPMTPPAAQSEASPAPAKVQKPVEKETSPTAIQAPPATPGVVSGTGKTIAEPSPSGAAVTPSSFKITVIVWDEDPSKRWAMINGMKTTLGSVIEGAKVEEINLTGVRLFLNGRYFEISMN
jgi:general secretion pathway protein B